MVVVHGGRSYHKQPGSNSRFANKMIAIGLNRLHGKAADYELLVKSESSFVPQQKLGKTWKGHQSFKGDEKLNGYNGGGKSRHPQPERAKS